MFAVAAQAIVIAAAIFFLLLGAFAFVWPGQVRRFLLGFAGSARKHYAKLATRLVIGGAMLLFAPRTSFPMLLAAFGWLLVATTAVMALVPWRLHRRFAEATVPKALRFLPLLGVCSLVIGGLLLASAWVPFDP